MEFGCSLLVSVFSALALISGQAVYADSHTDSVCDPSQLNTTACLSAVHQMMADDDRFWFGTQFNASCPPFTFTWPCGNADKGHTSILTRMRQSNDNSYDSIQQILNVTYDAPAGSYKACGNTYRVPAVTETLDPTQASSISLWSADHLPHVSWRSEVGKMYTLIIWDAGALFLHGLMYNIKGSNLDHAQTAYNYRGPKNTVDREQPYAFLLYEQTTELTSSYVTNILIADFSDALNIAPNTIVRALSLTGPIGASFLIVRNDPYASGYMKVNRIRNTCPDMLTPTPVMSRPHLLMRTEHLLNGKLRGTAFSALPLSINVTGVTLMSSVDVEFTTPDVTFASCCRKTTVVSNSKMANPMGNGPITPVYLRHSPRVSLVPSNLFDTYYYMRNMYSLIMIDVTDELANAPQPVTGIHWQIVNIREGDVKSGMTTLPYRQPLPRRSDGRRVVMLLLLKQTAPINVSHVMEDNERTCPQSFTGSCSINLNKFVSEHSLTVEGASWFTTSSDAYSRHMNVRLNLQTMEQECNGIDSYTPDCPIVTCTTGGTGITRASFLVLFVSSLFFLLS